MTFYFVDSCLCRGLSPVLQHPLAAGRENNSSESRLESHGKSPTPNTGFEVSRKLNNSFLHYKSKAGTEKKTATKQDSKRSGKVGVKSNRGSGDRRRTTVTCPGHVHDRQDQ